MNAPLDDKTLDEYLSRGSEVSRRYRELDDDAVPPELDRRVLAEARAAASKNQSGGRAWMRWSAPVALAASAVLVVSIVMESGVDDEARRELTGQAADARFAKEEASAPKAAAAPAEQPVEVFTGMVPDATFEPQAPPEPRAPGRSVRSRDAALAKQSDEQPRLQGLTSQAPTEEEVQVTASRPAAPVTMTSPVTVHTYTADEALQEAVVTGQRRTEQRRTNGPRDTIARSSARGATAGAEAELVDRAFKKSTPEQWLEEIRQLRRDGEVHEADVQWEQFRKQFPDFPVAEDDIAVKRP